MEFKNLLFNRFNRKKFFITAGTGVAGYLFLRRFPFNFIGKKEERVTVKINPGAVSRNKTGAKNV